MRTKLPPHRPPRCNSPPRIQPTSQTARMSAPREASPPEQPKVPKQPKALKRKRTAYDLEDTFEVTVGKQPRRFTIHTDVFSGRSGVLAALHRPEPDSQEQPVDLKGEDPKLFQAYLNCVYFGSETLEQWADTAEAENEAEPDDEKRKEEQAAANLVFERLIRLYLLAERMADFKTANVAIGEIIRASDHLGYIPMQGPISLAYASTEKDSPMRTLLRDYWMVLHRMWTFVLL